MSQQELPDMQWIAITPEYFRTLQTPVLRGRALTEADNENSALVVVINERAAKRWWPNENPIGQKIWIAKSMGPQFADPGPREIVGIVGDMRNEGLRYRATAATYLPLPQVQTGVMPLLSRLLPLSVAVRAAGDPSALAPAVQKQIWAADAEQPIVDVRPYVDIARKSLATERFMTWLLGAFGGVALLLAAVGIYGLMSYSVTQRWHEIGIRMALGASRSGILRLILGDGMRLALIGVVAGVVLSLGLMRALQALLYGVKPWDIALYTGVAVLLAVVAAVASLLPARRATRVDPMIALRYE
jgi:predicted permease